MAIKAIKIGKKAATATTTPPIKDFKFMGCLNKSLRNFISTLADLTLAAVIDIAARAGCAKLINRKRFDKYEKEDAVSIGRVSMMEFSSKEEADHSEELYDKIREEAFPTLELVVNIRTGPTSILSFAVYPSYESAASNLEGREKFQKEISAGLKDSFFHEGEVTYFFQPEPKPEN